MKRANKSIPGFGQVLLLGLFFLLLFPPDTRGCVPTPTPTPTPTPVPTADSPYSATASGWTRPEAPTELTAERDTTNTTRQINLQWRDNSDHETGFLIERSLGNTDPWETVATTDLNTTSCTDTGVASGTQYYYRARAIIEGGSQSLISAAAMARTGLDSPASVNVNYISKTSQKISWTSVHGATGYKLYRAVAGSDEYELIADGITDLWFIDSSQLEGIQYQYKIVAISPDGGGESSVFNPSTAGATIEHFVAVKDQAGKTIVHFDDNGNLVISGVLQANSPEDLNTLAAGSSALWSLKNESGSVVAVILQGSGVPGAPACEMKIKLALFTGQTIQAAPTHLFTVTKGPKAEILAAMDGDGNLYVKGIVDDDGTPTGLVAKGTSTSTILLQWPVAGNEALSGVTLERLGSNGQYATIATQGEGLEDGDYYKFVDGELKPDTEYIYRLNYTQGGSVKVSNSQTGLTYPAKPSFKQILAISESMIFIELDEPSSQPSHCTYELYRSTIVGGETVTVGPFDTYGLYYADTNGLTENTAYEYWVIARNSSGNSEPSDPRSVTTPKKAIYTLTVLRENSFIEIKTPEKVIIGHPGPAAYSTTYPGGTVVTLGCLNFSLINPGGVLDHWEVNGEAPPLSDMINPQEIRVVMDGDKTVRPIFKFGLLYVQPYEEEAAAFRLTSTSGEEQLIRAAYSANLTLNPHQHYFSVSGLQVGKYRGQENQEHTTEYVGQEIHEHFNVLRYTLDDSYLAGEQILVTLKNNVLADDGTRVNKPYVWKFTAETERVYGPITYGRNLPIPTDPGQVLKVTAVAPLALKVGDERKVFAVLGCDNQENRIVRVTSQGSVSRTFAQLAAPQSIPAAQTSAIAVGDLNGQSGQPDAGLPDCVVGNYGGGNSIYIGGSDPENPDLPYKFIQIHQLSTQDKTLALAIGDLDGDGNNDIVVGNDRQPNKVYLNIIGMHVPQPIFTEILFGGGKTKTVALALADIDIDGDLDIITANQGLRDGKGQGIIYLNDGTGHFTADDDSPQAVRFGPEIGMMTSLAVGDFDKNWIDQSYFTIDGYNLGKIVGCPDIAVGFMGSPNRVYLNQGGGIFIEEKLPGPQGEEFSGSTTSIAAGDIDGDGFLDLVVGNADGESNPIYINRQYNTVLRRFNGFDLKAWAGSGMDAESAARANTHALALADWDGDGSLDLIVGNQDEPSQIYQPDIERITPGTEDDQYSVGYAYDWAIAEIKWNHPFDSKPLFKPDRADHTNDSYDMDCSDESPSVATDGKGHWVMVWASNNPLNYLSAANSGSHADDFFATPTDYDLGDDVDIVIARFWDEKNSTKHYPSKTLDPWSSNRTDADKLWTPMDKDTLWTQPIPIDPDGAKDDMLVDKNPSIATDGHGAWAVVWVAYPPQPDPQLSPVIKVAYSNDHCKSWETHVLAETHIHGLDVDWIHPDKLFVSETIAPRIVCDGQYPLSHWVISYPGVDSRHAQTPAPDIGQDVDLYTYTNIVDYSSNPELGAWGNWPSEPARLNSTGGIVFSGDPPIPATFDGLVVEQDGVATPPQLDDSRFWANDCVGPFGDVGAYFCNATAKGLDMSTDGAGNWIAVWQANGCPSISYDPASQSSVVQYVGYDTDIFFSLSTDNGTNWSAPHLLNTIGRTDCQIPLGWQTDFVDWPGSPRYRDINPVIRTDGKGKWMVFWLTNNELSLMDYDISRFISASDSPYKDLDIVYATVTTDQLLDEYIYHAGTREFISNPWSQPRLLLPSQTYHESREYLENEGYFIGSDFPLTSAYGLTSATSGNGLWIVTWGQGHAAKEYNKYSHIFGKSVIHYAVSSDNGVTWNDQDHAALYSLKVPLPGGQHSPAIACDRNANYLISWVINGDGEDVGNYSKPSADIIDKSNLDLIDSDIVTARSPGLLPDGCSLPTVENFKIKVDKPKPSDVTYDKNTDACYTPDIMNGMDGFPQTGPIRLAEDIKHLSYDSSDPRDWSVEGSEVDAEYKSSVVIFHSPIASPAPGSEVFGINSINDIRRIDLAFWGYRKGTYPGGLEETLPSDFSVYVFKSGLKNEGQYVYDPETDWSDPDAWEWVGDWAESKYRGERVVTLTRHFDEYLRVDQEDGVDHKFAGLNNRPAGTLTWAVVSKRNTPINAELLYDYVRASAFKFDPDQRERLDLQTSKLTFYATLASLVPDEDPDVQGRFRLTLDPANDKLSYRLRLQHGIPVAQGVQGLSLKLCNAADQPLIELCSITQEINANNEDDNVSYPNPATFEETIMSDVEAEGLYAELIWTQGTTQRTIAKCRLDVDWDDDGLIDKLETPEKEKTNPLDRDSDDDGLLDGEEANLIGLGAYAPTGCDPNKVDTDGDGLADGLELGLDQDTLVSRKIETSTPKSVAGNNKDIFGTAPPSEGNHHAATGLLLVDQDPRDWTDPDKPDTDGDGYWDGSDMWVDLGNAGRMLRTGEDYNADGKYVSEGTDETAETTDDESDPVNPCSRPNLGRDLDMDSDKDGLTDSQEIEHDTLLYDADSDDDGISDGDEILIYGTNPLCPDTDWDGLPDAIELGVSTSIYPQDTALGCKYSALRKGYILDENGKLGILEDIPTYSELGYTPNRTNPWEPDSDYDGIFDREEDWNGNGKVDPPYIESETGNLITETDPARGIAALPYETSSASMRDIILDDAPYTYFQKPSPPVSDRYRIVFFYRHEEEAANYWEAKFGLAKGDGEEYPVIEIVPSDAAYVEYEPNEPLESREIKFTRIRTTGPQINNFTITLKNPDNLEFRTHRISIDPNSYNEWDDEQSGTMSLLTSSVQASQGQSRQPLSGNDAMMSGANGPGGNMPPVDGSGLWDVSEGAFLSDKAADKAGTDPLEPIDTIMLLVTKEGREAIYQGVVDLVGAFSRGEITIGSDQVSKFILSAGHEILKGLAYVPCVIINVSFRIGGKPLEFWTIWIQHWRYRLQLEAPEDFLAFSYSIVLRMVDHEVIANSVTHLEQTRGWRSVLGEPSHYIISKKRVQIPVEEAGKLPPGWIIIKDADGVPDGMVLIEAPEKQMIGKSWEKACEVFQKSGFKLGSINVKAVEVYSVQYTNPSSPDLEAKGRDHTAVLNDGTILLGESKGGGNTEAHLGESPNGWVQNDPVHNQINDVKHFYYVDKVNDINGRDASIDERLAAIRNSNMPEELKAHYESSYLYAQHAKGTELREWLAKQDGEDLIKKYKLPTDRIERLTDADLINFKDKHAQLYFDYMEHLGRKDIEITYYRRAVPAIFLSPNNKKQRVRGYGKMIDNWDEFWDHHLGKGVRPKLVEDICKDVKAGAVKYSKYKLRKALKAKFGF